MVHGTLSGIEYTSPDQAGDYVATYGLNIPASYDPENFWGQFSDSVPHSFLINLLTMRLEWHGLAVEKSEIRDLLDTYLN